jgi:hypothetical protein
VTEVRRVEWTRRIGIPLPIRSTEHYHVERNHQGLGNELIDDRCNSTNMSGEIERHERLGGVLNYYRRAA